jgi:glycosyltransferase involved in cell wall biosynthesis
LKILLYTHTFFPNIGGCEDLADVLASGWTESGEQVTVVTPTKSNFERETSYSVVRNPSLPQLIDLASKHDIVHANGTTMRLFPLAVLLGKPFTWAHHGYQIQCIDGAGWAQGAPAPMKPWESFLHHLKLFGVARACIGGLKLALRRTVGALVSANIATSKHVALRQPLARQEIILNPINAKFFSTASKEEAEKNLLKARYTFTFIGRLISEKGLADLLKALKVVQEQEDKQFGGKISTLRIIGDGPEKTSLQNLGKNLGLDDCLSWEFYPSHELREQLVTAGICVIPSAWEEPGALIVLELLAMGKPLIVSERGWLSECAGDACLTFPNGDWHALAKVMLKLAHDPALQLSLVNKALSRRSQFDPKTSIVKYLSLFRKVLSKRDA